MGSETRVCPGLIGWVVVEEFAGMMYFFGLNYYIIVIDSHLQHQFPLPSPPHNTHHIPISKKYLNISLSLSPTPKLPPWILNKDMMRMNNPSLKIPRCNSQTWLLLQTQKTLNASKENGAKISTLHSSMRNTSAIVLRVDTGRPILLVTNGTMTLTLKPSLPGTKNWSKFSLETLTRVIWVLILTSTSPSRSPSIRSDFISANSLHLSRMTDGRYDQINVTYKSTEKVIPIMKAYSPSVCF